MPPLDFSIGAASLRAATNGWDVFRVLHRSLGADDCDTHRSSYGIHNDTLENTARLHDVIEAEHTHSEMYMLPRNLEVRKWSLF